MGRIFLTPFKKDNYMFSDESGVFLNLVQPIASTTVLTEKLELAIKYGKVIDVDNKFNVQVSDLIKQNNDNILKFFKIEPLDGESEGDKEEPTPPIEPSNPDEVSKENDQSKTKKTKTKKK